MAWLAMEDWGTCSPSSFGYSLNSAAASGLTVKITKENMYYIFVYLVRNTLKLTKNRLNSLGTKNHMQRRRGKFKLCPFTSFLATPLRTLGQGGTSPYVLSI